ncbi:DUF7657 domain-containing protein [Spirosoma rhododendri]|uniref:Glycosyltransferase RgtA/B/C/D-like domain-containing protein n=1 Tax=Spirosoma rhododendri TaxID=2728024 RepID=A0A7L5DRW0_9BACT|nr:hypothetical protein [Spirosoma rhododendri]QJD78677.1 hypothetical protein HH216_09745 [Spirosoma rhododendri]
MSKSNKKRIAPPISRPVAAPDAGRATPSAVATSPATPVAPPFVPDQPETGFQLIRFDRRTKWYMGIVTGLFILLSLLKIHTLSVAMWNQLIPDGSDPKRGIMSGTPQAIRMDEYAVWVPNTLSNANQGYPVANESLGGEKIALLGAPAYHPLMIFKPLLWGHFFLGPEQAIAWQSNFNYFAVLLLPFLLFMLLTGNNFLLSVFGSVWLWLSSASQMWNGGCDMAVGLFSLLFVSGIYILFGKHSLLGKIGWGLLFGWTLFSALVLVYPPFQVPLGYTFLILFIAYCLRHKDQFRFDSDQWTAIGIGAGALVLVGVAFYTSYRDLKPTVEAMVNTVYPGRRSESGGTGFIANWFSEYYSWLITPQRYPKSWLNICELSHYLTFTPVIAASLLIYFVAKRRVDWMLALLALWILAQLVWIEYGWPKWLAEGTLMSMSPTRRTQVPLGVSGVILTILYLAYLTRHQLVTGAGAKALAIAGALGFVVYTAYVNLNDTEGLFRSYQLFLPVLFFTFLNVLLLINVQVKYRTALFAGAVVLYLLPNLKFNPVAVGLAPIMQHNIYKTVQEIDKKDPGKRWVVFGSQYISYLVTATGVKLLSGVKTLPARNIMHVLDPVAKRDSAYNRYAHTVYQTYIDGRDSVIIQQSFEDAYTVGMDPCSPRFKELKVKYLIFDREPQPVEVRCAKLISNMGSVKIYERTDE